MGSDGDWEHVVEGSVSVEELAGNGHQPMMFNECSTSNMVGAQASDGLQFNKGNDHLSVNGTFGAFSAPEPNHMSRSILNSGTPDWSMRQTESEGQSEGYSNYSNSNDNGISNGLNSGISNGGPQLDSNSVTNHDPGTDTHSSGSYALQSDVRNGNGWSDHQTPQINTSDILINNGSQSQFRNPQQCFQYPATLPRPSQLRYEYTPHNQMNFPATAIEGSSPRYHQGGVYSGPITPATLQFQESNLRTPSQQQQQYVNPDRIQLPYPRPRHFSHRTSTPTHNAEWPYNSGKPPSHQEYLTQNTALPTMSDSSVRNSHGLPTSNQASSRRRRFKREVSPNSSLQPFRQLRNSTRRMTTGYAVDLTNEGMDIQSKSDDQYVEELLDAMTGADEAEDNQGMLNTWIKIRENKLDKIRAKAAEMLELIKLAQYEPLGGKKAIHQYDSFDHRFNETVAALKSQKTVCKHLMEAPYSHVVANDPTYAAQRVRNNRRVNGQKREAITRGRQVMGLQGQGKGNKLKQKQNQHLEEGSPAYGSEDAEGDDDFEEDELGEEEYSSSPLNPVQATANKSRKTAKKGRYFVNADDDDDYVESSAPKKIKREREQDRERSGPSNYQVLDSGQSSQSSHIASPQTPTNGGQLPHVGSYPIHQRVRPAFPGANYGYGQSMQYQNPYPFAAPSLPQTMNSYPYGPSLGRHFDGLPSSWQDNHASDVEQEYPDQLTPNLEEGDHAFAAESDLGFGPPAI